MDVVVDNIGRTMIWSNFQVFINRHIAIELTQYGMFQWGFLVSNLEWITFVCNHNKGLEWKSKFKENVPVFVNLVMANGKTDLDAYQLENNDYIQVISKVSKHFMVP